MLTVTVCKWCRYYHLLWLSNTLEYPAYISIIFHIMKSPEGARKLVFPSFLVAGVKACDSDSTNQTGL